MRFALEPEPTMLFVPVTLTKPIDEVLIPASEVLKFSFNTLISKSCSKASTGVNLRDNTSFSSMFPVTSPNLEDVLNTLPFSKVIISALGVGNV